MRLPKIKNLLTASVFLSTINCVSAQTCPSASANTTIAISCSTGIAWTGGSLTTGNGSSSISVTNTSGLYSIEANSNSLGSFLNTFNSSIGLTSIGAGLQNDSNSTILELSNYGSILGGAGIWNDGNINNLSNSGTIGDAAGNGIWNTGNITTLSNYQSIVSGFGATGIYNSGTMTTVNNFGSITSDGNGTGIYNDGSGIISILNNAGSITVGGSGWGINNHGIISTLNNAGSITVGAGGYAIFNGNSILNLNNLGSLNAINGKGIWNTGNVTTLNNYGSINEGAGGVLNEGTIGTLNNYGQIVDYAGGGGITNEQSISILNNVGSISSSMAGSSNISNDGNIGLLINSGSLTENGLLGTGIGNGGAIVTLINSGSVVVDNSGIGIYNSGTIGTIINSGSIAAGNSGTGIWNDSSGAIITVTNIGSITGGTGSTGILNNGSITTLNNSQGGNQSSPSTTALSFSGNMPTNYNIGFISPTHYGQLSTDPGSSPIIANVGIYGTPFLTSRIYASVLLGDVTVTNLQNKYDNMTIALVSNSLTNNWDITFTGVSLMGTQQSLVNTAGALAPVFTLQNSVLANSLSYDCNTFGENNICISAGGRNTAISAANGLNNTSALLIASYRPHPHYRIGAYADQNLSVNNAGTTVNLGNNTPLIGIFGAWNERLDGAGTEVKVSAAYGQKNTTINRQAVGLSESGTGSSQLNSQGVQAIAKYGFSITEDTIASPYMGIRYTQNNMNGYSEAATITTTLPLTYSALNTNATTALIGVGGSYKGIPKTTLFASAGIESDTNTSNGSYYGSNASIPGISSVNFNPNPVKTRPTATLGAYYDIVKNQRLGITGIYRQEPFQSISSTTVMATYTVGL
jgi:hypothetical protein